jgi:hypothetical protein
VDPWDGWEAARVILLVTAVMYAGIWVQLTLLHWAGAFKRRVMYSPVALTPLFALAPVLGAIERDGPLGWVALGLLGFAIFEGLTGVFFHLQGINYQIGGLLSLRNMLTGPPPILPLAYSLIGVVGVIALVWNA